MHLQALIDFWLHGPKVRVTFWQSFHNKKSKGRHRGSFSKTQRGKDRRAERRFKLRQRAADYDATASPYAPSIELHNRKKPFR